MKKFSLLFAIFISINSFGQIKEKEPETITIEATPDIEEPSKNENSIYNSFGVEVKPEFPGGIEKFHLYSQKKIKIPEEIKTQKIKGKVFVSFIIEKNGKLSDIKVIRDIGYGTKEIVEKFLKNSPNWKPGKLNGKTVRCYYSIPITIDGTK
jgi:protein TonB